MEYGAGEVRHFPAPLLNMGFSQIVAQAKDSIDNCETAKQLKSFLTSVARSTSRFANTLKDKRFGGTDWVDPISYFLEFWAPTSAQAESDWKLVESALRDLRQFTTSIPDDESAEDYKADAKSLTISALATVETIYNFQVQTDGRISLALANLARDIENVPKVLGQAAKGAADIIANRIVAPIADASAYSFQKILWSIIKGFWWLFLLVAIIVVMYIWLVNAGGFAALAGKAAHG